LPSRCCARGDFRRPFTHKASPRRPRRLPHQRRRPDLLTAEQLDQLLAPIALYPDNLLAQTLMASTYPLEVVEASRWASAEQEAEGRSAQKAVDAQTWDDSVKSLVATPSVLDMMRRQLSWTQKLGDAVLAQQSDVMDRCSGCAPRAGRRRSSKPPRSRRSRSRPSRTSR
jgi:hypothetical protein